MSMATCEHRVTTLLPGTFFCRHERVHTVDQLVDQALCRQCTQREQPCLAPRSVPEDPLKPPSTAAPQQTLEYISTERLIQDTRDLIRRLPSDLSGIAGIPRSGLLPASYLAMTLHRPLYELCRERGLRRVGHGLRLETGALQDGPLLVIDDSVYSGYAMGMARRALARTCPTRAAIFAALYPRPATSSCVDVYARLAPEPHLFEWNLFNCNQTSTFAFDLDGVLCHDWTGDNLDGDGPEYRSFVRDAQPKWLPRRGVLALIVTARLERYRAETEDWLRRHGIRVRELIMGPWATARERRDSYDAGHFKGRAYRQSGCRLFIESDPSQAEAIFRAAGKPVLCPVTGRVFQ